MAHPEHATHLKAPSASKASASLRPSWPGNKLSMLRKWMRLGGGWESCCSLRMEGGTCHTGTSSGLRNGTSGGDRGAGCWEEDAANAGGFVRPLLLLLLVLALVLMHLKLRACCSEASTSRSSWRSGTGGRILGIEMMMEGGRLAQAAACGSKNDWPCLTQH